MEDNRSISSRSSRSSKSSHSSRSSLASDGSGDRQQWGGQAEFILTLVGYAVGLGNVWRFPYLCYKNGGGAFLIPYFLMLVFVGLPVFYLEISFGQFASLGPLKIWNVNPMFKGLGIAMVATNTLIAGYYAVIISWAMYFFFASMAKEVPWARCDNSWNTPLCILPEQAANISKYNLTIEFDNKTYTTSDLQTPPEEYFYLNVLKLSSGIDDFGLPVWQLSCTLLLVWIIVFFVLLKGIGSLGKVVYFTSLFPYVIMTIMVGRGCTLDGALDGILYYVKPDWERLKEPSCWSDAATQIFYSLSTCTGGIIAMASYNKFDNNALRDSIIVPIINCLTSFYSGFAIFSVLGFMSYTKGVPMDEVAADGPGLVFVVYPEGLMQLPISPLWSVLFFFMMLTLGFSSVFSMAECFFSAVIDEFPERLQKNRAFIVSFRAIGCLLFFGFGFTMTFNGGFYLFNIVDSFTGGFPLLFVGLFEFIAISYVYGYFNFADDIALMSGSRPSCFFAATWMVISPILLLATIVFLAVMYEPLTVEGYEYPLWGQGIGWLVVCICMVGIPLVFCVQFCRFGAGKIIADNSKPTDAWGPSLARNRRGTKYDNKQREEDTMTPSKSGLSPTAIENFGYTPYSRTDEQALGTFSPFSISDKVDSPNNKSSTAKSWLEHEQGRTQGTAGSNAYDNPSYTQNGDIDLPPYNGNAPIRAPVVPPIDNKYDDNYMDSTTF